MADYGKGSLTMRILALVLCCTLLVTPLMAFGATKATQAEASTKVQDVGGWGKTTWDMTIEQVIKLYPKAESYSPTTLHLSGVEINESPSNRKYWRVFFYFDSDTKKLDGVMLSMAEADNLNKSGSVDELYFTVMEKGLTGKYGASSYRGAEPSLLKISTWNFRTTTITLQFESYTSTGGKFLSIKYDPTNKLTRLREVL